MPPPRAPAPSPLPTSGAAALAEEAIAEHMKRIADLQKELDAERMEGEQRRKKAARSDSDLSDLHSELVCSICQDWLVHAATIECSHTFCWACIDTWLLQKRFECPVCRTAVTREPIRGRALDTIVQKTTERLGEEQRDEFTKRVQAADAADEKGKRLHADLEKSVNEALRKGKAFFHIDSSWSRKEKETFQRGIKDYTGNTRATYCKLTGMTVQWVHSADATKLNQCLHNLQLQTFVDKPEEDIRQRLLMFLRYG
jgi:hypothetical protein